MNATITIGDVAQIVSKGTTPTSLGLPYSHSGIPFLRGEDIHGAAINFHTVRTFIDNSVHATLSRSALKRGDVLITIAGTIGRVGYISEGVEANCNQAVAFVRLHNGQIDPSWLCLLLSSPPYQQLFSEFTVGGAIPNINLEQISSIKIPVIPIDEQRRIAAQLRAQLAEVETALKAAKEQASQLSRLVETAIEDSVMGALQQGQKTVELGDVAEIAAKLVDPRLPEMKKLPHVSAENIVSMTGELLNLKTADEDGMKSNKYLFEPGNILYSKLRPYLRKVAIADFRGVCSADMYPLKPSTNLNSGFLRLLLSSQMFTDYAKEKSARSRMPKLNRDQLLSWKFRLPDIDHQTQCAKAAESIRVEARAATNAAIAMRKNLELLPSCLLSQAF